MSKIYSEVSTQGRKDWLLLHAKAQKYMYFHDLKGTVMQIEKTQINDRLRVLKVS